MNRLQKAATVTAGSLILMAFSALPSMAWQVKIENRTEWALNPTFFARTTDYTKQQYFQNDQDRVRGYRTGRDRRLFPCFATAR
jgi:hypothetical protein